ncbi:hypothetical protein EPR50_G00076440 [Perca flavescens]|uniref:Uncharacterized protein n=1 Tax=Perca flavescens TaxID=8167 RepID=A0A484D5M8_PERFV|nr:hypothetical protein EPR50_G00076440 [Perca flavescens]
MQKTWVRVRLSSTIYGSNFGGNVVAFEAEAYAILGEEASSAHQTFPATASSVRLPHQHKSGKLNWMTLLKWSH